jgi:AcrR family transcriptional regulator
MPVRGAAAPAPPREARSRAYRREPDEKRDRIAAAARALFSERGFAGTTTAQIAAHAGVSEGIVFHHFGSKRELFAHVAAAYGRGLAHAMFGERPGESDVAPHVAIRHAFDYVRENQSLHWLLMLRDPELADLAHARTREEIVGALEAVFRGLRERGLLRPMDPRIVAELMYALVGGALEACFLEDRGRNEEQYLSEVVQCVVGALAPLAPDGSIRGASLGDPEQE